MSAPDLDPRAAGHQVNGADRPVRLPVPHRPAGTGASGSATVKVVDGTVMVTGWSTRDHDVLTAADRAEQAGEELSEWLGRLVRVGAIASTAASTGTDLAQLDRALADLAERVSTDVSAAVAQLTGAVSAAVDPERGDLAVAAQAAVTRLASGVAALVTGPEATVPNRVRDAVQQVTGEALAEIHRVLAAHAERVNTAVTADRDAVRAAVTAALGAHHQELAGVLAEVRDALSTRAATAAAAAAGPGKGHTFEADAAGLFGRIAAAAGDGGADRVGGTSGRDGTRAGDLTVDFVSLGQPAPVLVVEAKDRPGSPLTVTDWRAALAAAKTARGATVAVGLTPPGQVPGRGRVVLLDATSLVLGWEPGEPDDLPTAVYLLSRLAALSAARPAGNIDTARAAALVHELVEAMRPLEAIQTQAATATRAIGRITDAAAMLRGGLEDRIAELQATLTGDQP